MAENFNNATVYVRITNGDGSKFVPLPTIQGMSAYQIAIKNGVIDSTVSEKEWLKTLGIKDFNGTDKGLVPMPKELENAEDGKYFLNNKGQWEKIEIEQFDGNNDGLVPKPDQTTGERALLDDGTWGTIATEAVLYAEQELNDSQKETARNNINAGTASAYIDNGDLVITDSYYSTDIEYNVAENLANQINEKQPLINEDNKLPLEYVDLQGNSFLTEADKQQLENLNSKYDANNFPKLQGDITDSTSNSQGTYYPNTKQVYDLYYDNFETLNQIAEGKRATYVYADKDALDEALEDNEFKESLKTGDVFLLKDATTPDYWWDGEGIVELEARRFTIPTTVAELTDSTDYLKKNDANNTYQKIINENNKLNLSANNVEGLATVAFSGSYNNLSNRPTIPAAQVNSDWNASSGKAQILNKPSNVVTGVSAAYKIRALTQTEYNNITSKDSNTIYLITG